MFRTHDVNNLLWPLSEDSIREHCSNHWVPHWLLLEPPMNHKREVQPMVLPWEHSSNLWKSFLHVGYRYSWMRVHRMANTTFMAVSNCHIMGLFVSHWSGSRSAIHALVPIPDTACWMKWTSRLDHWSRSRSVELFPYITDSGPISWLLFINWLSGINSVATSTSSLAHR